MKFIDSPKNQRVKEIKKLHTKKGRDERGLFLIEGMHLVEEALKYEGLITELFVQEAFLLPPHWDVKNISVTYVSERALKEIAQTASPQGIVAVCKQFSHEVPYAPGTYLLVDRVQDPGNVGAMIRTADAAGLTAVILGDGTVDMYNDKVIRSSQGSIFHLPVVKNNLAEWMDNASEEIQIFGTALTDAKPYDTVEKQKYFALIVGNEGEGVSPALLGKTKKNLYIPIYGKAESLNVSVAAGILLYHLKRPS